MSTPRRGIITARKATTAEWAAYLEPLDAGRLGQDTETGELRVGDGSSLWADLGAVGGGGTAVYRNYTVSLTEPNAVTVDDLFAGVALGAPLNVGDLLIDVLWAFTEEFTGGDSVPDFRVRLGADNLLGLTLGATGATDDYFNSMPVSDDTENLLSWGQNPHALSGLAVGQNSNYWSPWPVLTALPLELWVEDDNDSGNPIDSTAGTVIITVVTVTPVPGTVG